MKNTKKGILLFMFFLTFGVIQAQKMWISGMYLNNNIQYYENGKLLNMPTVWSTSTNGDVPNNKNIAVYGEFKKHNGSWYFDIEKLSSKVDVFSGTFTKKNWNCPISGTTEGIIVKDNGNKVEIASFQPLQDGQYITVTEAAWGTKECNGKTHSVYYIKNKQTATENSPIYQQQRLVDYNGNFIDEKGETEVIRGEIVAVNKIPNLNVPNLQGLKTDDGYVIYISSKSPISTIVAKGQSSYKTLKGYYKNTYHDGVKDATQIFYVTEVK